MEFIGYHGTSEASARNILAVGIQERFLPPRGQIGRGFYIARMNGTLPQWAAGNATAAGRSQLSYFARMVSLLTGEANNPYIGPDARPLILKIYAVRPLQRCRWNIMNAFDLAALAGGAPLDLARDCQWLQMVVPPEELQYLRARWDDGVYERPTNWLPNESPDSVSMRPTNWFRYESPF